MATEVEALIGEIHARWGKKDEGYLRRLAEVDPFQLYLAAVHSMLSNFETHLALQEQDPDLHSLLHAEKEWLTQRGQWPETPPTLESLLAPG